MILRKISILSPDLFRNLQVHPCPLRGVIGKFRELFSICSLNFGDFSQVLFEDISRRDEAKFFEVAMIIIEIEIFSNMGGGRNFSKFE